MYTIVSGMYNYPVDLGIFELVSTTRSDDKQLLDVRDFSSVCSLGLIEDVLCRDLNLLVCEVLLNHKKIDGRGCDDDIDIGIELGVIDCFDKGLGAGKQPVYGCQRSAPAWCRGGPLLILKF